MRVNHGFDLLDKGRNDRCGSRKPGGYVVREWDGSLYRVTVQQVHGSGFDRWTEGVTFKYRDGLKHRVSLKYFCSIVVGVWVPSAYAYHDYGAGGIIRVSPPKVLPCALTLE